MTRDWLLTLLVMSPILFAATIVVLALIGKPAQNERLGPAAKANAPLRWRGSVRSFEPHDYEAGSR